MILNLEYFRGARCVADIRDAARKVLETNGLDFSLEAVAKAADVPRSVVKFHFPDIETLRGQILEDYFHQYLPEMLTRNFDRLSLSKHSLCELDLVNLFIDTIQTLVQDKPEFFLADIQHPIDTNSREWSFFSAILDHYLSLVDEFIDDGRRAGVITPSLTSDSARTFLRGLFLGSTVQCLYLKNRYDPAYFFQKVKEQAQGMLCAGSYDWRMLTD